MPKFSPITVRVSLAIFVFFFFAFVSYRFFAKLPSYQLPPAEPFVQIRDIKIPVELARNPVEIKRGLSGRLSLDQDKGMLFMFRTPSYYRFWMPNMHFPLDFVWIGSNKKIVDITRDVSNNFDPVNPTFYQPKQPAQYVLEVNAGFVKKTGIKLGDQVNFKINS